MGLSAALSPCLSAIDPKQVTADYEAGILVLTLPKAEDERNKVVKVSVAGAKPAIAEATDSAAHDAAEATAAQ